ncbi:MAG: RepB family plasmid replication initiator protein, partial [Bacteroidaceae bacterium]|nr:RepB family plasmid replication initiator protein [Bacteroidaceae bacterium]
SLVQQQLMLSVIGQLQDRIREQLCQKEKNSLFKPEDFAGNLLTFEIPLKDLDISPKKYGELEQACEQLIHLDMSYKRHDEATDMEYHVKQNIFHKIEFPTSEVNAKGEKIAYKSGVRRKGVIRLQMIDESAHEILNLRKGYTRHVADIASICRSPRSPRLYIYLSAWRSLKKCEVNYIDLKEFCGVLFFSKDHKRITENKYPKYGAFHRDVLDPVQRELKKLCDEGKVEFYFDYEPVYPKGVTRGDPDCIRFILHEGQLGVQQKFENEMSKLHAGMITKYGLQPMEWENIRALMWNGIDMQEELAYIDRLIAEQQPTYVHSFVYKVLYEWLLKQKRPEDVTYDSAEEVYDERPTRPVVSAEMRERWNTWMERCRERLGDEFYNTFMCPCDIWSVREKRIFVAVPSSYVRDKWESRIAEVS